MSMAFEEYDVLATAFLTPPLQPIRGDEWAVMKEARFREMAAGKLEAMAGLGKLLDWIDRENVKKAAVTNAPRCMTTLSEGLVFKTLISTRKVTQQNPP